MKTQLTPGPWNIEKSKDCFHIIENKNDWPIATISFDPKLDEPHMIKTDLSNAHLIAAAPELLAVAKTLEFWIEKGIVELANPIYEGSLEGLQSLVKKAISKSEGRKA